MIEITQPTWHRESYDRFVLERLPELLSERLPLAGYSAEYPTETTVKITIAIATKDGEVSTTFEGLARPDAEGLLWIGGERRQDLGPEWRHPHVVVPFADNEDLAIATIKCIGEHLYDHIEAQLGEAADGLPWDETLLRSWVPLDTWFQTYFTTSTSSQWLDKTNWLSRHTHERRIWIAPATGALVAANIGRLSPLETPEGPNVNKVASIAAGAIIKDGKLIVIDDTPEAGFSLTGLMIPFIEHSSDARLIMACNMMRQWLPIASPEPAMVQTGYEPDAPGFWCGRNLLTAYVPWGENTFEDAVVMSASCAKRFLTEIVPTHWYRDAFSPIQAGDKLCNRHGAKCTISRILPDDEMPHLHGVPVDLVYSPAGVTSRLNLGQLWEAAASRIAHTTGEPLVAPPFHGPSQAELRARFRELALPEDALDQLTLGKDGPNLERPSCVGWVYWGRLDHEAFNKVNYTTDPPTRPKQIFMDLPLGGQLQGYLEYSALRDLGAYETIREHYNTRSVRNPEAATLAERLSLGPVKQSAAPPPAFGDLVSRLAAAGIEAQVVGGRLSFSQTSPTGGLELAAPVAHPWLRDAEVTVIGKHAGVPAYDDVVKVNAQIQRLMRSKAPEKLIRKGVLELEATVETYFEALINPDTLRWREDVTFSGRAVLSPGSDLAYDEVGMPEEMAWALFAPMLRREVTDADAIANRTPEAAAALDAIMSRSWVLLYSIALYYDPQYVHTPLLAARPVRQSGNVIRVPLRTTSLMNVDFDGDHIAVLLPVTEAGQREAGELLTARAYLQRNPKLLASMRPSMDALWGLASLSLNESGRRELIGLGIDPLPEGLLTGRTVTDALLRIHDRDGLDAAIKAAEAMSRRGFEAARRSGWSIGPFLGHTVEFPPKPDEADWLEQWPRYAEEVTDLLSSKPGFDDNDTDPARLSALCGARGIIRHLLYYVSGIGSVVDIDGSTVPIPSSLVDGISPEQSTLLALGTRQAWYRDVKREMSLGSPRASLTAFGSWPTAPASPAGHHVLARAMRAEYPGAVFARAAAAGEVDPLTDIDSRLFVGV